ncbi:MAG: efflux RND transporter periplasmic adaptor subunit [Tenuifilum sp.]|uniref:HlyD family secretion protein n=1 Tax=Tenuifilum sp. TaxID=2760880 RepID=UPI003C8DD60F
MNWKNLIKVILPAAIVISCSRNNGKADAYGNIESNDVTISAEVGGKLLELKIDEGYKVEKNQLIGIVDTLPQVLKLKQLNAQLKAAKAKLQGIDAQIAVQDEQLNVLKKELDRVKKLLADSAATLRQLDDIEGKFKIAEKQKATFDAQRSGVLAEIDAVDAQIAQALDLLWRCHMVSPVSGTVISRYVSQGELVITGKPVCKIGTLDTVYARVYIDETQLPDFSIGRKVTILTDTSDGKLKEDKGEIAWVSSEAEFTPKIIQTRNERVNLVYAVKVRVPNPNGYFKIGMPVEVRIED